MNLLEFTQLVVRMRDAQREYFRNKRIRQHDCADVLSTARELERHVDREAAQILNGQMKLWDDRKSN